MPSDPNRLMALAPMSANDLATILTGMGLGVTDCTGRTVFAHQLAPKLLERLATASGQGVHTHFHVAQAKDIAATARKLLDASALVVEAASAAQRDDRRDPSADAAIGLVAQALSDLLRRLDVERGGDRLLLAGLDFWLDAYGDRIPTKASNLAEVAAHG